MKLLPKVLLVAAGLFGNSAMAAWQLDNSQSQLNFLSTKKAQITETHHFKTLSGEISDLGKVTVEIDLASVDTLIPIRNERMQEFLFETNQFAKATITAQLKPAQLQSIEAGSVTQMDVNAQLNLHGQSQNLALSLVVFKDNKGNISAVSRQPVLINAADFKLVDGVNKLQELAGLPSITYVVPVTFSLRFNVQA
ncbi:YceI family protein [Catenovulum sp. 2E275]|uniref:YceI family protein n=1 Tax=Catenovulum sp. 2E275 TaxID=2980497 RepID=UPI0021D0CFC0|nr:YceI family protein [Catenovulum sp. 2E275]MCU4674360.1 YceI family protein [Catenovulum sp. 2E275]